MRGSGCDRASGFAVGCADSFGFTGFAVGCADRFAYASRSERQRIYSGERGERAGWGNVAPGLGTISRAPGFETSLVD
jgi:hypothetical protein